MSMLQKENYRLDIGLLLHEKVQRKALSLKPSTCELFEGDRSGPQPSRAVPSLATSGFQQRHRVATCRPGVFACLSPPEIDRRESAA